MADDTFVAFDTSLGNFVVELYNQATPLTVANFLSYVQSPSGASYAGSFFHRLVPGFVLQGGGYAISNNSVVTIPTNPPLQNEYSSGNPNVARTIAMAKLSGDPNSATDQFFFNLADNSSNLDNQNGGFTVFGRVVENWNIVLALGNLPVQNLGAPFDQLPVVGAVGASGVTTSNLAAFSVAVVQPIGNTQTGQGVLDDASVTPFSTVTLDDPGNPGGAGDTISIAIEDASGTATATLGSLALPASAAGGLTLSTSAPGVYVLSGADSIALLQTGLRNLVYTPAAITKETSPASVTLAISLQTPGGSFSNQSSTLVINHDVLGPIVASVQTANLAVLRLPLSQTDATNVAQQINSGAQTLSQFTTGLIASEQTLYTTLAALVTIDAMYNATPSSAILTAAATATGGVSYYTAAALHNLGYSDPNVWTIIGSEWSADPNSGFYSSYSSYGSDYSSFISAVYQREFGYAPATQNLLNLLNDVPGVQQLLAGGGHPAAPIQVVGGIYGYLLYVGQTYGIGQYATSANAFLQAAANGTVTYGPELTKQFPPPPTHTATSFGTSSGVVMTVAWNADPGIVTVTASNQLIDPGPDYPTIQFMAGTSADTLVLHAGCVDQISGFDPSTDVLDFRSLLSEANIDLGGNLALLAKYVGVSDRGSDALIAFAPNGQASGATVAVLHGLAGTVTGLDNLIAAGAVRIT